MIWYRYRYNLYVLCRVVPALISSTLLLKIASEAISKVKYYVYCLCTKSLWMSTWLICYFNNVYNYVPSTVVSIKEAMIYVFTLLISW